jgi:hypothetical protein
LQQDPSDWLTIEQVVDLFVAMGCEPREFAGVDVAPFAKWRVRFLRSPVNGRIVSISWFLPGDRVAPSTLDSWERVLGIQIPRGPSR